MNHRIVLAGTLCLFMSACGERDVGAPIRPATVPATATWAGGPDGGAWLNCVTLEHTANRYRCTAYDDYAGAVWVEGDFVLGRSHWDEARKKASFASVSSSPSAFKYTAFDGETIYLAGAMVLVPDGWIINYPGEAGEVRQFFEMGVHRSGEAEE